MASSREVSDSIHRREHDMRRRFVEGVNTEELHDAVADVGEDLLLAGVPKPTSTAVPAHQNRRDDAPLLGTDAGRARVLTCDPDDAKRAMVALAYLLERTEQADVVPAADPRDLIQALRHPVLWLLTGALWAVVGGLTWLIWRWVA